MPRSPAQPGELRHPITIETPVDTQSASGAVQQSWQTFHRCTAKIDPAGGTETEYTDATLGQEPTKVTIRYARGVTSKMRVNYEGRLLNIVAVNDWLERRIWMILICSEKK